MASFVNQLGEQINMVLFRKQMVKFGFEKMQWVHFGTLKDKKLYKK